MANWISSKLRAAETILQQIDQQAAESLRKNEKPLADDLNLGTPAKTGGSVPLKDQLKKKTIENSDYRGKLTSDPSFNLVNSNSNSSDGNNNNRDKEKEIVAIQKPKPTLTDSDWTQLLSAPSQATASTASRGNGFPGVRGLRKDGRRQGSASSISNLSVLEVKKNQKSGSNNVLKSGRRASVGEGSKLNGKVSDGEDSGFSFSDSAQRSSTAEAKSDGKILEGRELDYRDMALNTTVETKDKGNEENGGHDAKELTLEGSLRPVKKNDGVSNKKIGRENVGRLRSSTDRGRHESSEVSRSSTSEDLKRGFTSVSDGSSESDTDSGSSSDSESEREKEERRKKREKILAEKAAAKAVEAIKERENMVARLEGEKQSLEKILEEQVKQQAQEASKLQMIMMETMEAADLEKQKHNNTRMEAFLRLVKLETANADLAKSLATVQWNLEVEVNQVAELRHQVELKEVNRQEVRRKISDTHQTKISLNKVAASKGVQLEREILEAEFAFVTDKVGQLRDKAQKLEANIEMTRKEIEDPTEVEIELKRRLGQMTDHLIHKQAQVEALSSEKATLVFRIEAVSRLLDEGKSMTEFSGASSRDIESGRPLFEDRIRSGRKHLGSALQQLDSIFMAGAVFLRRNPAAKVWALIYFVCLHFWVIYILMSHSEASNEIKSGAVISLENINNTAGV